VSAPFKVRVGVAIAPSRHLSQATLASHWLRPDLASGDPPITWTKFKLVDPSIT
jgi:hypothetical protein